MNKFIKISKDTLLVSKKIFKISRWSSFALFFTLITSFIAILFDLKTIEQLTLFLPNLSEVNSEGTKELTLFLIFFSSSAFFRLLSILILEKNCAKIGSDLSNYICRNSFLNNNSKFSESDITSRLTTEIHILINGVIIPLFLAFLSLLQISAILIATVILKGILSILVLILLGALYILFFKINNKKLKLIDKEQNTIRRKTLETIRVLFYGLDELKTYNKTENYLKSYSKQSYRLYQNDSLNKILAQYPKFIIEILGPVFIFSIISFLKFQNNFDDRNSILELLLLVGFLAQKLLPAVQTLYSQLTALKSYNIVLKRTYNNLRDKNWKINKKPLDVFSRSKIYNKDNSNIKEIEVKKWTHNQTNLSIKNPISFGSGQITCIKGSSGIGKTIFIKSLLGYEDSTLELRIKYFDKNNNIDSFSGNLGNILPISYMPQKPIILSKSIKDNINLGLIYPKKFIHKTAYDFLDLGLYGIFKSNKNININSMIGPEGFKLSGGQIQRIGLARTFANGSNLILLDEPSSALDSNSEYEMLQIMRNYVNLGNSIVMISHSENIHNFADKIIDFSKEIS